MNRPDLGVRRLRAERHRGIIAPSRRHLPSMTICIAAIAPKVRAIVAVSDTKVSDQWRSEDEKFLKIRPLQNKWSVMFAGERIDYFDRFLQQLMSWFERHKTPSGEYRRDFHSIALALECAYDAELTHAIEREVLARFGATRAQFRKSGLAQFGPRLHAQLAKEIKAVHLPTSQMMAVGLDDYRDPHIIVMEEGKILDYTRYEFHAIGNGASLALGYLQGYPKFNRSDRLGAVTYRVHAAKFVSEHADGVGKDQTFTHVFHYDGQIWINSGAAESRVHFTAEIARGVPDDVSSAVEGSMTKGWV
jgi:hypothetical protein